MRKFFLASAALITLFSITACKTLVTTIQDPVLSFQSAELVSINFEGAELVCKVQIENPNAFNIPFPDIDWELFINAASFISNTLKNNQEIKAHSSVVVDVPVNLKYFDMFNSFKILIGTRQADYKIALGFKFSHPMLKDKVWNFDYSNSLPILQPPRARTPSMRMENANTTRAELTVTINIENPNSFELPMPKIEYDYQLNKNSFIKGNLENEGILAANKVTPVSFKLVVTYADLFRSFSSLMNQFQANSLLVLNCDFGIPALSIEPQRYEIAGTLPVLR